MRIMFELFDPLEQFETGFALCKAWFPGFLGLPLFSFSFGLFFILVIALLIVYMVTIYKLKSGRFLRIFWLAVISFLISTAKQNLSKEQFGHFPFIVLYFVFIIFANVVGMVPYSITLTSQILLTLVLALLIFITITVLGVLEHKLLILNLFLPAGTPVMIAPFLTLIEIVSYTSRVLSLSIRLFANMTSGHTLLKILCGFAWTLLCVGSLSTVIFVFPVLVICAVTLLEFTIAFLQGYVFVLLWLIYLHDLQGGGH
jgi:ATP synthase subunit 6